MSSALVCRIPPPWFNMQFKHLLELCGVFQHLNELIAGPLKPTPPDPLLHRAQDHVWVANYFWRKGVEEVGQLRFQLILVHND
ncbi:MAG TPA: hypothetical protein VJM51_03415 [Dehalococcoidia bacterium]|nr:hypothetical protein [Dehalococcoidia bacterium]